MHRRSAPTYLTEKDGRIRYHYRLAVRHRGVLVVRWVDCLSEFPYDWRKSLDAVRRDRERRRREIMKEIEDGIAGGRNDTIRSWIPKYLRLIETRKKRTEADRRYLERAAGMWGDRRLGAITARDIEEGMEQMAESARSVRAKRGGELSPYSGRTTANRWRAAVSACLEEARRQHLIPSNPARDVRPYREPPPRSRVLTEDEQRRLARAILEEPDPIVRVAFAVLVETGARKSELLNARWEDIDLEEKMWRLPAPKSGHPQVVPLPDHLVEMLRELPQNSAWVIPGPRGRRSDLRGEWKRLKARAQLPSDITIHDIRRTYGLRIARSAGLHIASRLLRHSSIRVTERVYAPLGIEELRRASADASLLVSITPTITPKRKQKPARNAATLRQAGKHNSREDS